MAFAAGARTFPRRRGRPLRLEDSATLRLRRRNLRGGPGHAMGGGLGVLAVAVTLVALVGCGGGSGSDAQTLLRETFSGSHRLESGKLALALTVDPSGSSTLTGPIQVSFAGPFQNLGAGKVPKSNFTVSVSALGHSGALSILSTGTAGYVTLQGTSYQLPAATFQKLESSFAGLSGSKSGTSGLGHLGINPLGWLRSPSVVGDEPVDGTQTTHIRAGVQVGALLSDLNTFVRRASATGAASAAGLAGGLSGATEQRIAQEIRHPSLDVWTSKSDKTLRKLEVRMTIPVSGQVSTALGGLRSAGFDFTIQYSDVNQPETISAPTSLRPFSEFQTKLQGFLTQIAAATGSLGTSSSSGGASSSGAASGSGGASGSGTATGTTSGGGSAAAYGQCITAAGGDVKKMQQCASILNGQ